MKNSFASFLLFATPFVLSCGGTAESTRTSAQAAQATQPTQPTQPTAASGASTAGKGDCILSYQRKLDELLPLSVIKKHHVGDMPDAELEYRKSEPEKDASYDKYMYSWPGDRTFTMEMGGRKTTSPIQNEAGVMWVGSTLFTISGKATPLENFKAFYRNPTQEEMDKAFKIAEERIKSDPKYSKEQADTATDLAKGLSAREKFEDIAGIGDAASFNKEENYLTVLVGATLFQIIAGVSKDNAVNLEFAKKLATEVLAKCD